VAKEETYYHLFIKIQSLHNFISYFDNCYLENPTVVTFFDFSSLSTETQNILKHAAELLQFICKQRLPLIRHPSFYSQDIGTKHTLLKLDTM
jgi:hypothetical protein